MTTFTQWDTMEYLKTPEDMANYLEACLEEMGTEACVKYAKVDGMHFFVHGNDRTKGLCAGNMDLETAFKEATRQLEYLSAKTHPT